MLRKLREVMAFMRDLRAGTVDPAVTETLSREEENGAAALLYLRLLIFIFFIVGGVTASPNIKDAISNLIFASGYGVVLILQWYLLRRSMHRALHRFSYFMILADHALFTSLLVFYYATNGNGNFNHALKSPYMTLLLVPTLTTLVQFRQRLLLFSVSVLLLIVLGFYGFGRLSAVPVTTSWYQYMLGDAIIFPAWLGIWLLLPLILGAIVAYAIFRSIRMVTNIGKIEGQRRQLTRYFSPEVVEEIATMQNSVSGIKAGERRQVAVLFADIRSFTTLSEHMSPDEVAALLTELRALQTKTVFENHGMVDKFIGDAIMAVFGAPRSHGGYDADVAHAVACGLQMHQAISRFNSLRTAAGQSEIRIGIGIHAGEVFAGNLGDADRLEYTVIGDVVNTASRIEHLCKKAQADFLISEPVAEKIAAAIQTEKVGLVRIRGKDEPMPIYKVIHD
jgi:adenylate cyclase